MNSCTHDDPTRVCWCDGTAAFGSCSDSMESAVLLVLEDGFCLLSGCDESSDDVSAYFWQKSPCRTFSRMTPPKVCDNRNSSWDAVTDEVELQDLGSPAPSENFLQQLETSDQAWALSVKDIPGHRLQDRLASLRHTEERQTPLGQIMLSRCRCFAGKSCSERRLDVDDVSTAARPIRDASISSPISSVASSGLSFPSARVTATSTPCPIWKGTSGPDATDAQAGSSCDFLDSSNPSVAPNELRCLQMLHLPQEWHECSVESPRSSSVRSGSASSHTSGNTSCVPSTALKGRSRVEETDSTKVNCTEREEKYLCARSSFALQGAGSRVCSKSFSENVVREEVEDDGECEAGYRMRWKCRCDVRCKDWRRNGCGCWYAHLCGEQIRLQTAYPP